MIYLFTMAVVMALTMAVIPFTAYMAPRLGLLDQPSERKVHSAPMPRVGGIAIVPCALFGVLMLAPQDKVILSYLLGAFVLFVFGLWDDRREIGHYFKFTGQFIAALLVVIYGDVYVTNFPFFEPGLIPDFAAKSFTVIALVGMINAINHSDGLDGLASGEVLISLSAMAFLAYQAGGGDEVLIIALAAVGAIIGFLRYNTHPAKIFMGDTGSQFLGYTVGFLAILLTQRVDRSMSPAVALLLLGLPIVDILVVLKKRIREGRNWFKASKNHIHHRLLTLGFLHEESVIVIYSVQILCVTTGVLFCYQSDWVIIAIYLAITSMLFMYLRWAEAHGWNFDGTRSNIKNMGFIARLSKERIMIIIPRKLLVLSITLFLIGNSISISHVPHDFALLAAIVLSLAMLESILPRALDRKISRVTIYCTIAFVEFLSVQQQQTWIPGGIYLNSLSTLIVALAILIAMNSSPRRRAQEFNMTTTDYLLIFVLMASLFIINEMGLENDFISVLIPVLVLCYASELLITEERRSHRFLLRWSAMITLAVLCVRGFMY